jgi:type I restriction enzyme S subunit
MIVADPMLLWDGAIGIQRVVDAGLVSPDYRVYAASEGSDPAFLAYLVRSPHMISCYQGGARGTNIRRNRIARTDFQAIPLNLPPLTEQRKIAAIISSIDEFLEQSQAVISQLQIVKEAMLGELLVRGLPGRHASFKDADIGKIPSSWEVSSLGEVCVPGGLQTGPFGSQLKASEYTPLGIPVIMPKDLIDQHVSTESVARIPESRAGSLPKHRVEPGDILFGRRGDIGRCALVREAERGWICGTGCLRARLDQNIDPEFLVRWLASGPIVAWLTERAVGQTMLNLNTEILGGTPIVIPPIKEQAEIATVVSSIEQRINASREILANSNELKAALISVLLTGELRVTLDEAP